MLKYDVYATESFQKLYKTLTKDEREWIHKIKDQLEDNPAGKPLHFNWFREKKYSSKRLYFLVDDAGKKILFMAFASKKEQQKIIDFVLANGDELLDYLHSL